MWNKFKCKILGHSVSSFLVKLDKAKDCTRCGKTLTNWRTFTIDDMIKKTKKPRLH